MMHHTRRWNHDHRDELRSAWLNGAGVLIWEWSSGYGWAGTRGTGRRCARMRAVYRRYAERTSLHGDWEPLTDLASDATATASRGRGGRLDGLSTSVSSSNSPRIP